MKKYAPVVLGGLILLCIILFFSTKKTPPNKDISPQTQTAQIAKPFTETEKEPDKGVNDKNEPDSQLILKSGVGGIRTVIYLGKKYFKGYFSEASLSPDKRKILAIHSGPEMFIIDVDGENFARIPFIVNGTSASNNSHIKIHSPIWENGNQFQITISLNTQTKYVQSLAVYGVDIDKLGVYSIKLNDNNSIMFVNYVDLQSIAH